MRIHRSVGTTPTILVIVVTIGDRRPCAGEPCTALRARPARVTGTGVTTGIPTAAATAPRDSAGGVGRLVTTRLRARRWPRATRGKRPVTAGGDAPTTCGGAVATAVSVVAVDGAGVEVSATRLIAALPEASDGSASGAERVRALSCGTCDGTALMTSSCRGSGPTRPRCPGSSGATWPETCSP